MTALLISAGLWPPAPEQEWNETILWQPVPYRYPPRRQDFVSVLMVVLKFNIGIRKISGYLNAWKIDMY